MSRQKRKKSPCPVARSTMLAIIERGCSRQLEDFIWVRQIQIDSASLQRHSGFFRALDLPCGQFGDAEEMEGSSCDQEWGFRVIPSGRVQVATTGTGATQVSAGAPGLCGFAGLKP